MPHENIVAAAIASYKQNLDDAVDAAQTLSLVPLFSLSFNTSQINKAWIKEALADLRTGYRADDRRKCVIYIFSLDGPGTNGTIAEALLRHKQARQLEDKKDNLCTINGAFPDSTTLYVGRSFTPKSRITQHLGESDNGTYAMHLQQWATSLGLTLRLDVYDVPAYRDTVNLERAMNVLETGLWDYLQPLLGRRGDK